MTDLVTDLAYRFADESARSDIECICLMFREDGLGPETPEEMSSAWYDVVNLTDQDDIEHVRRALQYLELRGMLKRHPTNTNWLQVRDEATIPRPA